jgi:hypothetical protein
MPGACLVTASVDAWCLPGARSSRQRNHHAISDADKGCAGMSLAENKALSSVAMLANV